MSDSGVASGGEALACVVFATCAAEPELQPDDLHLRDALASRGVEVVAVPWNGPFEPFACADLVLVRSTWDYQRYADAFLRWLDRLQHVGVRVVNDPALMRWNADKHYLLELAERGAPLPPTREVAADARSIGDAIASLGCVDAVVKPVFGAGASGLSIVPSGDAAALERAALRFSGRGLVQPLLAAIRASGETSLVFVDGAFSHAVLKLPRSDSILVQAEHGGHCEAGEVAAEDVEAARAVLTLLPSVPLYARVDMILGGGDGRHLMEVELIEPELFFRFAPGAPAVFADALLARLT